MKIKNIIFLVLFGFIVLQTKINCQVTFTKTWEDTTHTDTWDVVLGDVDNDHDLDVLLANGDDAGTVVYFNDSHGNLIDGQFLYESASAVDLGDIDNDEDLDICLINTDNIIHVWLNDGNGVFVVSGVELQTMSGLEEVHLNDLNADSLPDILVLNSEHPDELYFNNGDLTFTKSSQTFGPDTWDGCGSLDVGDINNDGYNDIVKGNWGNPSIQVWLNDGTGTFTEGIQSSENHTQHVHAVKLCDLDGDTDLDLFAGYSANNLGGEIWLNNGTGTFTLKQTFTSGVTNFFQDIAMADFDNDGDNDAFIATLQGNNILLLNDGTGEFTESEFQIEGDGSMAATAGFLNDDNDIDIFSADDSDGYNSIWINSPVVGKTNTIHTRDIKIYPSPAQSTIQIEYPGQHQNDVIYRIIDLNGKILQQGKLTGKPVDVSGLNKGLCLINLIVDKKIVNSKVIVE